MHPMSAPDRRGIYFREADSADLAGLNEIGHRADAFLDRRLGIDPMELIEIDDVDPQPLEARVACLLDVLGPAIEPAFGRIVGIANDPALGRDREPITLSFDGARDQLLVGV